MTGVVGSGVQGGGGGGGNTTATYVTSSDETGALPNSRELLPGTNITLDDSTPGELTIDSSGGGTPGGSTTQVQYNDSGAFAGSADLTWDDANQTLVIGTSANGSIQSGSPASATSNGRTLTLTAGTGGTTSGNGGNLTLQAGTPGSASGAGGVTTIRGGAAAATGNGGGVLIVGGLPTDGNGGPVQLTATAGVGTNRNGGSVILTCGTATGAGTPGSIGFANATTTGSQTATFTATNKPGTGTTAPTMWLRCTVGVTTFYIPMWQ